MMKRKTTYTHITPIPSFIPRQLAIDMLQSHGEIIELNPLVTGFEAIKAPRNAPADEFYASWYEISQRVQFIPGIGKLGSGAIKFNGCFHDMPWGLQTHTYAPAGVDLRNKWQICGNQPGEPPQTRELGLGAPPEGLYLREDIEIKCNLTMISFVKKELQAASKVLVDRLIKKAELLDSGVLQGMMENGKLKTVNPADRRTQDQRSPQPSPTQPYQMPMSPTRQSTFPQSINQHIPPQHLVGSTNNTIAMELPGDYYHPQHSPGMLHPHDNRASTASDSTYNSPHLPSDARWSQVSHSSASSRPSSYAPSEGMRSPGLDQKGFAAELPTMEETREEHDQRRERENEKPGGGAKYVYNPQDYARTQAQFAAPPVYAAQHGQGGGFAGGYGQR
ncbi:hypothetical protein CC86DRAFT_368831 [Ophiobolus disseminans]|uniref:DUF7053 domain-containing protein n=1 Tax=Ophiobolus disseminans TaxID=1469910 RepID=A0A6A7A7D1_9PLEO|nr:hypothetical protein CC86DRAFT_368831 [Ophiobolus disseminans]